MLQPLTIFGAIAVAIMLVAYILERRSLWWVLVFALACAASSTYGWLSGTWPFGVIEGVWALVALRRWWNAWRTGQTPEGEHAIAAPPAHIEQAPSAAPRVRSGMGEEYSTQATPKVVGRPACACQGCGSVAPSRFSMRPALPMIPR